LKSLADWQALAAGLRPESMRLLAEEVL